MDIGLLRKLKAIPDDKLCEVLTELTEKDRSARDLVRKYSLSTKALNLPRHYEIKETISKVMRKARESTASEEIELYELPLLRNRLMATIDLWLESIFHKRRYDLLLILSGLVTTYNFDPFNDRFLFPGIEVEINLRIKRFLESLSSPERRDFFSTIFELVETGLYPKDLGGPAAFLIRVLGQLESSSLDFDLDLLSFYEEYFGDIKENLIISGDLSYLPLFVHYCHLVKIYRNDASYHEVINKSRFLREIIPKRSSCSYYPQSWEKEHLVKLLSYPLYLQVTYKESKVNESILNFEDYIKEHDLNDHFIYLKRKN